MRRDDGTWLLTGEPVSVPAEAAAELVRQRRRLMPVTDESTGRRDEPDRRAEPGDRLQSMQASLEAARAAAEQHRREFEVLQAETASLRERTVELRALGREHVQRLRDAARRRHDA